MEENVIPITEFRTLPVTASEPTDRTVQGTVIGSGDALDLGTVDTTDEAQDTVVRVIWWRVCDMNGATEVPDIKIWLDGAGEFAGTNVWHMDITDAWTQGKTAVQVETGSPGSAPNAEESAAPVMKMGGGPITGTGHDQTSRYIYLSGRIGVNEPTGMKTGPSIRVKFQYR
jgi:hypothetical protein